MPQTSNCSAASANNAGDGLRKVNNRRRGVSLVGYGLVVGLISVVALSAITVTGESTTSLFGTTADALSGTVAVSSGGSSAATPDPNQPPLAGSPALDAWASDGTAWADSLVLAGASDPEAAGPVLLVGVSSPVNGTVGLNNGQVSWQFASGQTSGSFTFTIEDQDGAQATGTATVSSMGTPQHCAAVLAANPAATDTNRTIDPDGPGGVSAFVAECDMTTAGGGWTRLIHGSDTTQADLTRFPVVSNDINNFTSDPTYGISWGTFISTESQWNDPEEQNLRLTLSYDELYVQFTGTYNMPSGGLGRMQMHQQGNVSLFNFNDGNGGSGDFNGHGLAMVGDDYVLPTPTTNVFNQTAVVQASGSTQLNIKFHAYFNSFGYTRRYLHELWYR